MVSPSACRPPPRRRRLCTISGHDAFMWARIYREYIGYIGRPRSEPPSDRELETGETARKYSSTRLPRCLYSATAQRGTVGVQRFLTQLSTTNRQKGGNTRAAPRSERASSSGPLRADQGPGTTVRCKAVRFTTRKRERNGTFTLLSSLFPLPPPYDLAICSVCL